MKPKRIDGPHQLEAGDVFIWNSDPEAGPYRCVEINLHNAGRTYEIVDLSGRSGFGTAALLAVSTVITVALGWWLL